MRRLIRLATAAAGFLLLPFAVYGIAALVLSRVPTAGEPPAAEGVVVGVCSNGVHTDISLPMQAAGIDWSERIDRADFPGAPPEADRVRVGWGDRQFYLETPHWSDLRPSTALAALFGGGPSVLHIYLEATVPRRECRFFHLDAAAYRRLDAFIAASAPRGADGRLIPLPGASYGATDMFYDALGSYSPIRTCNQWTSRALAAAGLQTGLWTPFAGDVMRWLPEGR